MDTHRFQTALVRNEITAFFKGEGEYFARGCFWGVHLYGVNWKIMCTVLEPQSMAQFSLTALFTEYVMHLQENEEDAEGLLSNINAYYRLRKDFAFLCADNYDLIEQLAPAPKHVVGKLFRFLRLHYDIHNQHLPIPCFEDELEQLKNEGCTVDLEAL